MEKSIYTREYNALRRLLREVRRSAGISQAELAARLGETQSEVSKYERGERRLDMVQLRSLCTALGTPLADFVATWEDRLGQDWP